MPSGRAFVWVLLFSTSSCQQNANRRRVPLAPTLMRQERPCSPTIHHLSSRAFNFPRATLENTCHTYITSSNFTMHLLYRMTCVRCRKDASRDRNPTILEIRANCVKLACSRPPLAPKVANYVLLALPAQDWEPCCPWLPRQDTMCKMGN
jgi:hypothetical protein